MVKRVPAALVMVAIPALADSALFHQIRNDDQVTLVLPNGECDAKVLSRNLDRLTLRLKRKTDACGERDSLIVLSGSDVRDIVNNKRPAIRGDSHSASCALAAMSLIGAPGALAIGELTKSDPAALFVFLGNGVAAALLCRQRGTQYPVFAERIITSEDISSR